MTKKLDRNIESQELFRRKNFFASVFAFLFACTTMLLAGCVSSVTPAAEANDSPVIAASEFPEPIKRCVPKYPREAALGGIDGRVAILFSIDDEGRVFDIEITESTPNGVFDLSARRSLECWRYPKGAAVDRTTVTIEFNME